jgi:hypothetical protein
MLNKEDPGMAVSMIMAPENPELMAVLIDPGSREPAIWEEVKKILETEDDTREQTSMQNTAQKIIGGIGKAGAISTAAELQGWSYLGDFSSGSGTRVELPPGKLPEKDKSYELVMDTNLRADKPKPPAYSLASITGVATSGKTITINELDVDRKNRVWAKVAVSSR